MESFGISGRNGKANSGCFRRRPEIDIFYRRKLMHTVCRRAGVPYFGFHSIRHWVASYLYDRKKVGMAVVSKLLGHTNFQTTERYLQLVDPRLREAICHLDENVSFGGLELEHNEEKKLKLLANLLGQDWRKCMGIEPT
jgi:hypothetical protein